MSEENKSYKELREDTVPAETLEISPNRRRIRNRNSINTMMPFQRRITK